MRELVALNTPLLLVLVCLHEVPKHFCRKRLLLPLRWPSDLENATVSGILRKGNGESTNTMRRVLLNLGYQLGQFRILFQRIVTN
jgi:hypothetical protein